MKHLSILKDLPSMRNSNAVPTPIPSVINVVVIETATSFKRSDESPLYHPTAGHSKHHQHLKINESRLTPPHVNSRPIPMNMMMMDADDDTLSLVSSIFDEDDMLTINTFSVDDGVSLITFASPPSVMRIMNHQNNDTAGNVDGNGNVDGDDDDDDDASMVPIDHSAIHHQDNDAQRNVNGNGNVDGDGDGYESMVPMNHATDGIEIFQSIHHVRQTYPSAIISGRGGGNQHDVDCQAFIAASQRLQPYYQTLRRRADKRLVQLQLIESMEQQGRVFIRRNDDATFQLMSDAEKLEKVQKRLYVRPSMRNTNVPPPLVLQPPMETSPPDTFPMNTEMENTDSISICMEDDDLISISTSTSFLLGMIFDEDNDSVASFLRRMDFS